MTCDLNDEINTTLNLPLYKFLLVGHLDAMLRGLVLGRMGSYGCEHTIGEARKKLQCHVDGSACLPADLRAPVCI